MGAAETPLPTGWLRVVPSALGLALADALAELPRRFPQVSVLAWSEGFQDTILFREGQLANMFRYLADNPRRRAVKAFWPGLFKVVDELAVSLSLGPDQPPAHGRFSALGNRFLLGRPLVAMNRLCQWIVGEGAADVNYHGMKPENIDALARDAALVNR